MEDFQEKDRNQNLLRLARMSINFSLSLIGIGVLVIIMKFIPTVPDEPEIAAVKEETPAETVAIDSSEIKDGIHVPSGLIADTGFHLVLRTCAQCHSLDIVKQNRATEAGWKDMITWMQETQGLWDLGKDEAGILAYLGKNYAPTNSGRRRNLEGIVWYQLKE